MRTFPKQSAAKSKTLTVIITIISKSNNNFRVINCAGRALAGGKTLSEPTSRSECKTGSECKK